MAVLAPMPRASERTATMVKPGLLKRLRMPRRMSWRVLSRVDSQREVQTWCLMVLRLPIWLSGVAAGGFGGQAGVLLVGG